MRVDEEVAAAGADEVALRGVEADWGGVDDDDLPLAVLIKRLEQARVGVQLPAQEEAGEESEMWEGEEEEEEDDRQKCLRMLAKSGMSSCSRSCAQTPGLRQRQQLGRLAQARPPWLAAKTATAPWRAAARR